MTIQQKNYDPALMQGADNNVTAVAAVNDGTTTTGNAVAYVGSAITSGAVMKISGPGAGLLVGGDVLLVDMGAATTGDGIMVQTTGVYTATTASPCHLVANSATTGYIHLIEGNGLTSGVGVRVNALAATMTTGRYFQAYDGATEVFGIGANGHIHSTVSAAPPTIVVTSQAGITAAAITAGGSDTCGIITTTGTSTGATILDVTFGKTYTTAPKVVVLTPANAAAAMPNTGYFVSVIAATGFTVTIAAGGTYAATPSFRYLVIA